MSCHHEILRVWKWPNGYQCLLAVAESMLELRIVKGSAVLSRAGYTDLDYAADAIKGLCAVCGDTPVEEWDQDSGIEWRRCASCGDLRMATRNT
jgi:hypothetical protein